MSLYDTIKDDLDAIVTADEFFVEHKVENTKMLALVHSGAVSPRSSLIQLAAIEADCVLIVRKSDWGSGLPATGAYLDLDDVTWRVASASYCGHSLIKINLAEIEV